MGGERIFFKKKSSLSPLGFSHVSVENALVYSSRIKLSVCALHVCLEDAKQMTGAIAGGRKNTFESNSSEGASRGSPAPASTWWAASHTFSSRVLSLTVGGLR